ncbi:unnamed protein product [Bodo saltans]|uniref:Membrane-associated protein n=1 Tax=Bodo saltans TaxID=75058 RepID=A0A0S4JQW9_BODSA|nr:unnamed protein product [Bodo saltans]|eukprot:CUG93899.1 unnamed protein product [Bodo saltans]
MPSISLIVAVLFFVFAPSPATTLTCESANSTASALQISFPSRIAPGQRSAIVAEQAVSNISDANSTAPLSMAVGATLPVIIVRLTQVDPFTGNTLLDLAQRGYMINVATIFPSAILLLAQRGYMINVATIFPSAILLKGAAVAVVSGRGVFANLIPTECTTGTVYTLAFTLRSESGDALDVDPIYARVSCAASPAGSSVLSLGDTGFLTRSMANNAWIPSSIVMPSFSIVVTNLAGAATSIADVDITVAFSGNSSSVSRTVRKPPASTSVSVDSLTFVPSSSSALFTSLTISSPGLASVTVPLRIIQANLPNTFMRFSTTNALITQAGQAFSWVAGVPMQRIQIQFLTSKGELDTSTNGIIVTASCDADPSLSGNYASSVQGVAVFDSLVFSASSTPLSYGVLTFTAATSTVVSGPSNSASPSPLYTGPVTVTSSPLLASQLAFSDQSSITATSTPTILVDSSNAFSLTNIVVLVLDSTSNLDTTANSITVQLQLNALGSSGITPVVSSGGTATVSNGVAVFTSVVCNNGGEGATLQICVNDPTGVRQQICSGTAQLSTGSTSAASDIQKCASSVSNVASDCIYSLSWGSSPQSIVYENGQPMFATVGSIMPTIYVNLQDAFGDVSSPLDTSIVPVMVAYTGSSPAAERYLSSEGRVGYWLATHYVFSCLRFARKPPGSVTLKFAAVWSLATPQPYAWLPILQTGFVRVASSVTSSYGIRFSATNQIFSFAGQSSTAVIGVALPLIQIEVTDSNYMLDTTANSMIIDAFTSSGTLGADGASVTVTNGVAAFRLLTFTSGGLEPVITFRVRGSSLSSTTVTTLSGVYLSTGAILVTTATIPAASIVFVTSSTSDNNNITQPFQSFLFNDFSDAVLKVAVAITDSAHVIGSTAERTVTIKQTSAEAVLASNQEVTIAQGSSSTAYFDAAILSQQSGFDGAPIFLQFVVTTPTSSPILVGNTITIGPIFIGTQIASALEAGVGQCMTFYYTPVMVMTFHNSLLTFNMTSALAAVSTLLSLDTDKAVATADTTNGGYGLAAASLSVVALQAFSPSVRLVPMVVLQTASSDPVTLTRLQKAIDRHARKGTTTSTGGRLGTTESVPRVLRLRKRGGTTRHGRPEHFLSS